MTLILLTLVIALAFEYINGFHDTANSIATVVSTKVLTPRQAVILAATMDLLGALVGTAVAKTIASGLVEASIVSSQVLICALLGAIVWNLITWWLPASDHWWHGKGLLWKVLVPMVVSPVLGFTLGAIVMATLYITLQRV